MKSKYPNLTEGKIFIPLLKLSFPIIGIQLIETSFNIVDIAWLGRLNSSAVAGVLLASYIVWIFDSIMMLIKTGMEAKIAQSKGAENYYDIQEYSRNGIYTAFLINCLLGIIIYFFSPIFVKFFNAELKVKIYSIEYLKIIGLFAPFYFSNIVLTAIDNGLGKTVTPFKYMFLNFIINLILDPLLIFGIGFFPRLEVKGAAYATVFANIVTFILLTRHLKKDYDYFNNSFLKFKFKWYYLQHIIRIGFPVAFQGAFFCIIAMFMTKIVAKFGTEALTTQGIGIKIESISYMTASGFATALSAIIGQNYGAGKWDRISKSYNICMGIIFSISAIITYIFIAFPEKIMTIFTKDITVINFGIDYLFILALSQLLMNVEISTEGAFAGLGNTLPSLIISMVFSIYRIPVAIFLSKENILGLNGIWWAITTSSIFKGTFAFIIFKILLDTKRKAIRI